MALASSDTTGIKAIKVRVNVTGQEHYAGIQCSGQFWTEGVTETVLSDDEGATGIPQIDEYTGLPKHIFTLEQKLSQFYVLEGRARVGESPGLPKAWRSWGEPRFAIPDYSGRDNPGPAARAKQLLRLDILDRQLADGSWESAPSANAAIAAKVAPQSIQPRK